MIRILRYHPICHKSRKYIYMHGHIPDLYQAPCTIANRCQTSSFLEVAITISTEMLTELLHARSNIDDRVHVLFLIDQLCETGGAERVLLNTVKLMPKGE